MIWPQNYRVTPDGFFEVLSDTRFDTQPVDFDIPIYQIDKESKRVVNIYNHPSEIDFLCKSEVRMFINFDFDVYHGNFTNHLGMVETKQYDYLHYMLVDINKRRNFCNTRNNK